MHLQTLIVEGFKSFAEAKIEFPQGVTAIVGPNGTGKSNIVDALLWSLGEQSPKSLRTEKMEDVIFNGTEVRKPMGMAEVSTIFGGVTEQELEALSALGDALAQSTEIMITRRLYRDGDSEYSINKIPCRLKDIRSLLWASRAGTKGHTVIEQGNIDQLLSASPLERREFIEETAGIIRYKKQKAEALRKLDSTEQNLFRVRDILAEVQRQLRSLERQARQARNYQELKSEAKNLEIQLLQWEYRQLRERQRGIDLELEESETQELAQISEEKRLLAEQEVIKLDLAKTGESVTLSREQLREVEQAMGHSLTSIEVLRNQLEHYEEQHEQAMNERTRVKEEADQSQGLAEAITERIAHVEGQIESLEQSVIDGEEQQSALLEKRSATSEELDRLRTTLLDLTVKKTNTENRLESFDERRSGLARRLERLLLECAEAEAQQTRLSSEGDELRQQREALAETLEQLCAKRGESEQSVQSLSASQKALDGRLLEGRTSIAGIESELRALRAVLHEEFGYSATGEIEETSIRGACREVKEVFAERMVVEEHAEKAIEAALGDRINAWVVESPEDAVRAITTLKNQSLGRGSFLPVHLVASRTRDEAGWQQTLEDETAIRGSAISFVRTPEELQRATTLFLENVYVVESLEAGLQIMEKHQWFEGRGPLLVTADGETIHPSGVMTGGVVGESGGVLRRRGEILRLEAKAVELGTSLEQDQADRNTVAHDLELTQSQLQGLHQSIRETEVRLMSLQKEEGVRASALPEVIRRLETIRHEQQSEESEVTKLQEESALLQEQLTQLEATRVEREQELAHVSEDFAGVEDNVRALQAVMTETQMSLRTFQAQRTHEQSDLARLQQEEVARSTKLQQLDQQLEQLFLQTRQSRDERVRLEEMFEKAQDKKDGIERTLTEFQDQYNQVLEQTRLFDRQVADIREKLAETLKVRSGIEVRLAEVRTKLTTVEDTLTETYSLSLEALNVPVSTDSQLDEGEVEPESLPENSSELWKEQLETIRGKLGRMGPINLAAIEEHQELQERCEFLTTQEADLTTSIQSLQEIIQRLNQTTNKLFAETFKSIQEKFNEVFTALFAGGRAELVLVEPEEEEGDTKRRDAGVDIIAQPPGKRLKNLSMLSGGEKTMTVLALLFASFLIKPSPFCVLDEVDAPLDEANVGRFGQFLTQMAERSQFLIVTHNKRTMEVADSLFGVTMEQPGISKLVSVRLNELQDVS
ncbi:MAG: chromosome partition protein Smc [Nitrospirales bacterium]|nr:MAG: chromosome partition protein Smc [Nitrospirales bacterium]